MVILDLPNPIHTILELESSFTYQKHCLLHICQRMNHKDNIQNKPLEITMDNEDSGIQQNNECQRTLGFKYGL